MSESMHCGSGISSNVSSTNSLIAGSLTLKNIDKVEIAGNSQTSIGSAASSSGPWRSKLTNIKNSFLGTPRFHR